MAVAVQPQIIEKRGALDAALSIFGDVRPGEGVTTVLMLTNIFLILICYSVIKTIREPLILLGGGAEVRSYAAAGQALLLMAFVPFYSWFASRVNRGKLLIGVTLFFLINIELFALAVGAGVPYIGVAFFIWVGIFSISLIAQFWSYANDICTKEAGDRLFPIIALGMTLGAPLGSLAAARLFGQGLQPQVIIQLSALLLLISLLLYVAINAREKRRTATPEEPLAKGGGFGLVWRSGYLRLIAGLIILLNIVNTTGEYLIARLLTGQADALAASAPGFDKQAYIGAFAGNYQLWVNVAAFLLQAFVTSRLVKHKGLQGALLALPLIALGGYAIVAAGASFALVRWIKTAENATDYSIMNTARQLLWLPTSRVEKYKAKQAIDTFFMRFGDLLSAGIVFLGTSMLFDARAFAAANVVLTLVWIGIALLILKRHRALVQQSARVGLVLCVLGLGTPAFAQEPESRAEALRRQRDEKAGSLTPYERSGLEKAITVAEQRALAVAGREGLYPKLGSLTTGSGFALGAGFRSSPVFSHQGTLDTWVAGSLRKYWAAEIRAIFPELANGKLFAEGWASRREYPQEDFFGIGPESQRADESSFALNRTLFGARGGVRILRPLRIGGAAEYIQPSVGPGTDTRVPSTDALFNDSTAPGLAQQPDFVKTSGFVALDYRQPLNARRGGWYRLEFSHFHDRDLDAYSFKRVEADLRQFVPFLAERRVLAARAFVSTSEADDGNTVPFYLMPYLGGSDTLRGFREYRFRGPHSLLLQAEYRYEIWSGLDGALFYDTGKVALQRSDLRFSNLEKDYGFGFRFNTDNGVVARFDAGFGSKDGKHLYITFGGVF